MLVVVLAGAILRDINLMVIIAGLMTGLLVFNGLAAIVSVAKTDVQRTAAPLITAGEELIVDVTLANRKRWLGSWMVVVLDTLRRETPAPGEGDRATTASVVLGHVPARESRRASYRVRLYEPGRYQLGPLRIVCRFPLGFVRRSRKVAAAAEVLVAPQRGRLTPQWRLLVRESWAAGEQAQRRAALEGEFHGLRDWRTGDSRRAIHWRTTARRGELTVKQFDQPQQPDVAIVLDLAGLPADEPATAAVATRRRVESAVRFAATLVEDVCRQGGGRILLAAAANSPIRLVETASPAAVVAALRELAVVQLTADSATADDPLAETLRWTLSQVRPTTRLILVTTAEPRLAPRTAAAPDVADRLATQPMLCVDVSDAAFRDLFVDAN